MINLIIIWSLIWFNPRPIFRWNVYWGNKIFLHSTMEYNINIIVLMTSNYPSYPHHQAGKMRLLMIHISLQESRQNKNKRKQFFPIDVSSYKCADLKKICFFYHKMWIILFLKHPIRSPHYTPHQLSKWNVEHFSSNLQNTFVRIQL